MAALFWVGGIGTLNSVVTSHIATSSGGSPGAGPVTLGDTLTFDANSGLGSGGTITVATDAVCGGLVVSGIASALIFSFTGDVTWAAGTYSFQGGGQATPLSIQSNSASVVRTATINGTHGTHADVSFNNFAIAGTIGTLTGTRIGDRLGNSGITFTTPIDCYAVASGNWSATGTWASTSGGTAGTARVPLPQDTVHLDANTPGNISANLLNLGANLVTAGFTHTLTFTTAGRLYGNCQFAATMTVTQSPASTLTLFGRGSHTLDCQGIPLVLNAITVQSLGGTYRLLSDVVVVGVANSSTFQVITGTFIDSGFSITAQIFASVDSGLDRTIVKTGNWKFVGRAAAHTFWNVTVVSAALTITDTGTITITNTNPAAGGAMTFAGAGLSYGTLTNVGQTTGANVLITGSNTFAALDIETATAKTLTLPAGGTQTVTGATTTKGASGQLLSIVSSSPGTATTINANGGITLAFVSQSGDVIINARQHTADSGSGTDTASPHVRQTGSDAGTAADAATQRAVIAGIDAALGTELVPYRAAAGHDTGHGTDSSSILFTGHDTGHGTDAGRRTKPVTFPASTAGRVENPQVGTLVDEPGRV